MLGQASMSIKYVLQKKKDFYVEEKHLEKIHKLNCWIFKKVFLYQNSINTLYNLYYYDWDPSQSSGQAL